METTSLPDDDYRETPLITPHVTNTQPIMVNSTPQPKIYFFSLEEAPLLTIHPLYVPTHLPEGWRYTGGSISSEGIITLHISSFLIPILYIQAPVGSDIQETLSGPDMKNETINERETTYTCSEAGMLHQLSWPFRDSDYYLIGGQNCSELLQMASSLQELDYVVLDQLPHAVADPANSHPDPERIRLIFPVSWINARNSDRQNSRMIDITLSREEFNASFSPDPRAPYYLRHKDVQDDEDVAYLSLPKEMFDSISVGPQEIRIRYPRDYFIYFTDMESLYEFHFKDPNPARWIPAVPIDTRLITPPATLFLPTR